MSHLAKADRLSCLVCPPNKLSSSANEPSAGSLWSIGSNEDWGSRGLRLSRPVIWYVTPGKSRPVKLPCVPTHQCQLDLWIFMQAHRRLHLPAISCKPLRAYATLRSPGPRLPKSDFYADILSLLYQMTVLGSRKGNMISLPCYYHHPKIWYYRYVLWLLRNGYIIFHSSYDAQLSLEFKTHY